jgi:hypothetical protein
MFSSSVVPRAEAARRAAEAMREAIILILVEEGVEAMIRSCRNANGPTNTTTLRAYMHVIIQHILVQRKKRKWWQHAPTLMLLTQRHRLFCPSFFRPSCRPPSLATANLSRASFAFRCTPQQQQRDLHSSPSSFDKRVRSNTKLSKAAMSESSSSSKSKRRQREANAAQDSSPPPKKPVYSIFEKKTSEPSAPAEVRWKTNGTSFIVGEAFKPQPGAKVAAYDLV